MDWNMKSEMVISKRKSDNQLTKSPNWRESNGNQKSGVLDESLQ